MSKKLSLVVLSLVGSVAFGAAGCKEKKLAFESVNPPSGRMGGNEEVRIRGSGFSSLGNLQDVRIGGKPATNVGVQGDDTIVLSSPEGREEDAEHPVDITMLTSDGRAIVLKNVFTFHAAAGAGGNNGPNEDLRRRL